MFIARNINCLGETLLWQYLHRMKTIINKCSREKKGVKILKLCWDVSDVICFNTIFQSNFCNKKYKKIQPETTTRWNQMYVLNFSCSLLICCLIISWVNLLIILHKLIHIFANYCITGFLWVLKRSLKDLIRTCTN